MSGFRARTLCVSLAIAAVLVMGLRGQVATHSVLQLELANVGLPAIEQGAMWDAAREPGSAEALRRAARSTALEARVGPSGRSYTAGRVIVRFHDDVPQQDRLNVVRLVSDTAGITVRPAYGD